MGYRKVPTIFTLEIEEYDGLVVRMKSLKVGRMRKLIALSADEESADAQMIDEMIDLVLEGLVSWNLEDEGGQPIEPTREACDDMEFKMLSEIVGVWLDKATGVTADLGKDSPSGKQFPGQPVTMEAL